MKPYSEENNFFKLNKNQKPLWEEKQNGFLVLLSWLRSFISQRLRYALQVIRVGRDALKAIASNSRYAIGMLNIGVGVCAVIFYHIFDESIRTSWYYVNWYYFFYTIREEMLIGFWAVGTFLLLPEKYTLSFIPCSLALAYAIGGVIHYTFFVSSNESFHDNLNVGLYIPSLSIAFGIIISSENLARRLHHWFAGNHARFVGMAEMKGKSLEEKEEIYTGLAREYRQINSRI